MTENPDSSEEKKIESISLMNDRVVVEVSTKGAFVKSLKIDGKDVIFSPTKENPRRGGIPILGPTPGHPKGSRWENLYPNMPTHGTDRNEVWTVNDQTDTNVVLQRVVGPKDFLFNGLLEVRVQLLASGLRILKSVTNLEDKPREIGSAFHPYFSVDEETEIAPDEVASYYPLKSGESEIIKPGVANVRIKNRAGSFRIDAEPEPTTTVVWSDNPGAYTCIEPWWAESGEGDVVGPRETKTYSLVIAKE